MLAWRSGRRTAPEGLGRRALHAARLVLSQERIVRRGGVAGIAHAFVFYGFLALFLGTVVLAVQDDVARPVFGFDFWRDDFYLGYSLMLDVFGAALLAGLVALSVHRALGPARYDYRRADGRDDAAAARRRVAGDRALLAALLFLAVSGFALEALRVAETAPSFERWAPVGWAAGHALRALGLHGDTAGTARLVLWWLHGLVALALVASVPFAKALHALAAPVSLALRDPLAGRRLPPVPAGVTPGCGAIGELAARHRLALAACTRCGRCHAACPAVAGGFPLSPRDLVFDLRAQDSAGRRERALGSPPFVAPETAWSCTQCLACVEACPVGIEHAPILVELRRRLVEDGDVGDELQDVFESLAETGNSSGEPRRNRGRWARELPFELKDARKEPVDLLWVVGDTASFDGRAQQATRALATLLHQAGVDVGLLWKGERSAGNDVRRASEEGLFLELAAANVAAISACSFRRILTADPHALNTLRHEYPEQGGDWTVVHHSQLLLELLGDGRLTPVRPLGLTVTYHDPCHLSRYCGEVEAPRAVLGAIGAKLVELPRNREASFCCGAGGGRIWLKDMPGTRRPSALRIEEAAALAGVTTFVVACPKDAVMFEDAVKTAGLGSRLVVRELAELVLAAVAP